MAESTSTMPEVEGSPKPGPQHKHLQVFVGKWITEAAPLPLSNSPPLDVTAVDEYEWLPGEFFLLHRVTSRHGENEIHGTEIIGYDEQSGTYPMYFFDHKGTTTVSQLSRNDDGSWAITAESQRSTIVFEEEGNAFSAAWERKSNGSDWEHWMDVRLFKAR